MTDRPTYFGIDLGTTYSAVAYLDASGEPVMVRSRTTSAETTPSVVYFERPAKTIVGSQAKSVADIYPDLVLQRVKRDMGEPRQWLINGVIYTPESVSAIILKSLAEDVRKQIGVDMTDVVITVPAYFGTQARDATRTAGRMAGLNVVGIIPEPVAAALEYQVASASGQRVILVYDLGGGTFDVSAIRISAAVVEVLCTAGSPALGGADWDEMLRSHVLGEFVSRANPVDDPRRDPAYLQELALSVEELKKALSEHESRQFPMRYAGNRAVLDVSRRRFETITRHLLDETIRCTDRALAALAGKLGVTDPARHIDEVLLVGGSSRMPMVAERLTAEYGWQPRLHSPDLVVAKGAARFALNQSIWSWDRLDRPPPSPRAAPQIIPVLPKSIGVKVTRSTEQGDTEYIDHVLHANDPLPSDVLVYHATTLTPDTTTVSVAIYEQAGSVESPDLSDNRPLEHGSGEITGLPPLPAGSPIRIEMRVDVEGLLALRAVEPISGKELTMGVRVGVLSPADIARGTATVAGTVVES